MDERALSADEQWAADGGTDDQDTPAEWAAMVAAGLRSGAEWAEQYVPAPEYDSAEAEVAYCMAMGMTFADYAADRLAEVETVAPDARLTVLALTLAAQRAPARIFLQAMAIYADVEHDWRQGGDVERWESEDLVCTTLPAVESKAHLAKSGIDWRDMV